MLKRIYWKKLRKKLINFLLSSFTCNEHVSRFDKRIYNPHEEVQSSQILNLLLIDVWIHGSGRRSLGLILVNALRHCNLCKCFLFLNFFFVSIKYSLSFKLLCSVTCKLFADLNFLLCFGKFFDRNK